MFLVCLLAPAGACLCLVSACLLACLLACLPAHLPACSCLYGCACLCPPSHTPLRILFERRVFFGSVNLFYICSVCLFVCLFGLAWLGLVCCHNNFESISAHNPAQPVVESSDCFVRACKLSIAMARIGNRFAIFEEASDFLCVIYPIVSCFYACLFICSGCGGAEAQEGAPCRSGAG
jgi:hypothetical protein